MRKFLFLMALTFALVGCEDSETDETSFEYEETMTDTMPNGDEKLMEIQNTNGSINIVGSDTATMITLEITRRVKSYRSSLNARDYINDIQVSYGSNAGVNGIIVDHPVNNDLDYEIDINITAPMIFDYDALMGNGNITMNSVSRNLAVTLGNGNILADVILLNDCDVKLEAGNGNIQIILPDITDAQLFATVGNGSISTTGLVINDKEMTSNTLTGYLGNGEGNIHIILGNGTLQLEGY